MKTIVIKRDGATIKIISSRDKSLVLNQITEIQESDNAIAHISFFYDQYDEKHKAFIYHYD